MMFYYVRVVFQNQIQAQQAIYVKQQQHQMAPQQGEFFKANDSMSALPTNFSDLAMNKEPQVSTRSTLLTAVQDPIVSQRVVLKLLCFTQYCSQKPMLGITYEIISCIELYHKYPLYEFSPSRLGNVYVATVFFFKFWLIIFMGLQQHSSAFQSQQSRLNQWKLPSLDKDGDLAGGEFSRAPGTTTKSSGGNSSPNLNPLLGQGDG